MALHRDIFWIGRQWAVTGSGMQAVNQKLGGQFDIGVARLWDDDWLDLLRGQSWFNVEDFAKGLAVARKRFPEPPGRPPPLPIEALLNMIAAPATPSAPKPTPEPLAPKAVEPVKPVSPPEAEPVLKSVAIAASESVIPAAPPQPEPIVKLGSIQAAEVAKFAPSFPQMRIAEHSARLVRVWRITQRK